MNGKNYNKELNGVDNWNLYFTRIWDNYERSIIKIDTYTDLSEKLRLELKEGVAWMFWNRAYVTLKNYCKKGDISKGEELKLLKWLDQKFFSRKVIFMREHKGYMQEFQFWNVDKRETSTTRKKKDKYVMIKKKIKSSSTPEPVLVPEPTPEPTPEPELMPKPMNDNQELIRDILSKISMGMTTGQLYHYLNTLNNGEEKITKEEIRDKVIVNIW